MAKKFNASQFKSQMRQIQQKQKQNINKLNREINNYNSAVRNYNNNIKRAINSYNSAVRTYNSSVKRARQIISQETTRLQAHSTVHTTYSVSLSAMQQSYRSVNAVYNENVPIDARQNRILDLLEQEQANSLITARFIESDTLPDENTDDIELGEKLMSVSPDLHNRWKGAIYALNPTNPDATRHFCTSARELFTEFLEIKAPDNLVFQYNPNCQKTEKGNATRRSKIEYMMRNNTFDKSVTEFVEDDIKNIVDLFSVLNGGTHGKAGKYEFEKLLQVKKRVEEGINFLCELSH